MKLVAISDQHGYLPDNLPDGDVLVVAGDICPVHNHELWFQKMWLEGDFTSWANSLTFKDIIVIGGNHDFYLEDVEILNNPVPFRFADNVHYLKDSGIVLDGIKFWGSPWSNIFGRWAFMAEDRVLAFRYDDIPNDVDVIISHSPPMGYGDFVEDEGYQGSVALRKKIQDIRPRLVVCGHIHEGYGMYPILGGQVINASLRNERYEVVNDPIVIEI